jgi:hypothetical protein
LEFESRVSCLLGKNSTTWASLFVITSFLRQGFPDFALAGPVLCSSCLCFLSTLDYRCGIPCPVFPLLVVSSVEYWLLF